MPKNDNYVELFYDHYKDTFEQIKGYIRRRNVCTFVVLSLIVFLSLQVSNPELASTISSEVINKKVGNVQIDFEYIKTVLYLSLLWVLSIYYRTILNIEKNYTYIHEIDNELSDAIIPFRIEREGKYYLTHYPYLLNFVDLLYSIILPISIILFTCFNWINEINNFSCFFWIRSIIFICTIVISLLYLSYKHFNDFKKKKNDFPQSVVSSKNTIFPHYRFSIHNENESYSNYLK